MKARVSLAAVAGMIGAIVVYAAIRVVQRLVLAEPDPSLVFLSEHSGYFWRAWTAAYAGGTFAFVAWLAAGRSPHGTARFLERAAVFAFVVALLQGVLLP